MSGKFFQIDRDVFRHVAQLGLNPLVSYLVMACGTGADNRTTSWSVNAIEKYTGIGRSLGRRSIDALITAGVVAQTQSGKKPRYRLQSLPNVRGQHPGISQTSQNDADTSWIWLPNSLITGVANEVTPLERIRGLQDIRSLQLLVTMYDHQNLAENGGLHWRHIRKPYNRKLITTRGIWNVWAFSSGDVEAWADQPILGEFQTGVLNNADHELGNEDFWHTIDSLVRLGLIECVPHLVEADTDEAVLILPCPGEQNAGTVEEKEIGYVVRRAGLAMLETSLPHHLNTDDEIMPVLVRFPKVQMVGIYRLRYRPQTAITAAWIARTKEYNDLLKLYSSLF